MLECVDCEHVGDYFEFTYINDRAEVTTSTFALQCSKCGSQNIREVIQKK